MSLGHGIFHHKSSKQKLNTKSSTEAELVGASDYIAWTLWTKRFLEEQGFKLLRNVFYQDNESAIKLEKNGKASSSGKTRHIHIRYFFMKDTIENEMIDVQHCPTEKMIADFYTKPLQGKLFKVMRDMLMGLAPMPTEERVSLSTKKGVRKISVEHESKPSNMKKVQDIISGLRLVPRRKRTYADVVSNV